MYLFLGLLVWVVVTVVGFDGIGFLRLLITDGKNKTTIKISLLNM